MAQSDWHFKDITVAVLEGFVEGRGKSRIWEASWRTLGLASSAGLGWTVTVQVKMGMGLRYLLKLELTEM